jgi:hypothetical protein
MKANELRIGNLTYRIEVKNKNNTVIDDITIYDMERIQEVHDKTFTYEPILLTEEWLLKFGFISDIDKTDNYFVKLKYGKFIFQSDLSVNFTKVYLRLNNSDVIIKYVHQLQNLYFALTNKELQYNNKM